MVLATTLIEAGVLAWVTTLILNLDLWLEILLGIIIGLIIGVVHRLLELLFVCVVNVHIKAFDKLNIFYIKDIMRTILLFTKVRVKYEGLENIDKSKSYLFIPNHKSNEDFLYIYVPIKQRVGFLCKNQLEEKTFTRNYAKMLHCVFINRDNDKEGAKAIIRTINNIKEGTSMIVFPEGTRTDYNTNNMLEGHAGTYKIGLKAKCDIIPVSCVNSHKVRKNSPWKRTKVKVIFHKPLAYEDYKDLSTSELEEKVRGIVNSSFEE